MKTTTKASPKMYRNAKAICLRETPQTSETFRRINEYARTVGKGATPALLALLDQILPMAIATERKLQSQRKKMLSAS